MKKRSIFVVYTNEKVSAKEAARMKRYVFNTSAPIKVGDMLQSPEYSTKMQVVKILEKSYKYYNGSTGELSDKLNSTTQWEIRDFIIREDSETAVYGRIIK